MREWMRVAFCDAWEHSSKSGKIGWEKVKVAYEMGMPGNTSDCVRNHRLNCFPWEGSLIASRPCACVAKIGKDLTHPGRARGGGGAEDGAIAP